MLLPLLLLACLAQLAQAQVQAQDPNLDKFKQAWQAAARGNRAQFEQIKSGLGDYVLYPYLQYQDLLYRRIIVAPGEMSVFLDGHPGWAFTAGLRKAWLLALGQNGKWSDLLKYATGEQDTEIQCYLAQASIQTGDTTQLLPQAQALWTVGKSQPDACDPVFTWLRKENGITPELAWQRISRAMEARNSGLTRYLARYLPARDQVWLERWQQQEIQGYTRLDQARRWGRHDKARDITGFGLKYLARKDADKAWKLFGLLDKKMHWDAGQRGAILREIALWSAVAHSSDAIPRLYSVPEADRDDKLLEWWARNGIATGNWAEVVIAVAGMSEDLKQSDRWQYWDAMARLKLGDTVFATDRLNQLSQQASYYGFLAADYLGRDYTICPENPPVDAAELSAFMERPEIRRVEALNAAGLKSWSRREWNLAIKQLDPDELRFAAAMATGQGRPDLAILALSGSANRNWYDWRVPLDFAPLVTKQAGKRNLDVASVMGLMRSESAMAEDAVSPANARGLMQVLPGTAAQLARRHGYAYRDAEQLMRAEDNIVFGTTFLRELMDRFDDNQVLVIGAYNAGPAAVARWLDALPMQDPVSWIENVPFYETRDYIPRVLAFATIYEWRLQLPVRRITSRMPAPDSGTMGAGSGVPVIAAVACPDPNAAKLPGS